MLMGRHTYEIFAKIYPSRTDPWAARLNPMQKYVFSSTLEKAAWDNSTIVTGDVALRSRSSSSRKGGTFSSGVMVFSRRPC
jgi:dihydrofolate reductase